MATGSKLDWGAIEAEYRNSTLGLREIAKRHGCVHSTIIAKANRYGWVRCPDARSIRARYTVEVEQNIIQSARIDMLAHTMSVHDKLRERVLEQIDQIRKEQLRRDSEARGHKRKATTGRPTNLMKDLIDCTTILERLVKVQSEMFKQQNMPPPSKPAQTGKDDPAPVEAGQPEAAAPVAVPSLAERLGLLEHEDAIRKAQQEHKTRHAGPEPVEKVVKLGSSG